MSFGSNSNNNGDKGFSLNWIIDSIRNPFSSSKQLMTLNSTGGDINNKFKYNESNLLLKSNDESSNADIYSFGNGDIVSNGNSNVDGNNDKKGQDDFGYKTFGYTRNWAYPVPTSKQYSKCKEANGQGMWDKRGVWRCLFPDMKEEKRSEMFKSYEDYLDWKVKNKESGNSYYGFGNNMGWNMTPFDIDIGDVFDSFTIPIFNSIGNVIPVSDRIFPAKKDENESNTTDLSLSKDLYNVSNNDSPSFERKAQSTSISRDTVLQDDGTYVTREKVKKWYSDGTSSETEKEYVVPKEKNDNSGWFW